MHHKRDPPRDWTKPRISSKSDALNLHLGAQRQRRDTDRAPRGSVRKVLSVLLVDLCESLHVRHENGRLSPNGIGSASQRGPLAIPITSHGRIWALCVYLVLRLTFVTFSIELPAASSTALRLWMHCRVMSVMLPSMILALRSIGTWPEQKTRPLATVAGE